MRKKLIALIMSAIFVLSACGAKSEDVAPVDNENKSANNIVTETGSEETDVESVTTQAKAIEVEMPVLASVKQKYATPLDEVHFYVATEEEPFPGYDFLYLDDVNYTNHTFPYPAYYSLFGEEAKCAFTVSKRGMTGFTESLQSEMVKVLRNLGLEAYPNAIDQREAVVISDVATMKRLFTGSNSETGYGEGDGYRDMFFSIMPALRSEFEPEVPKALQNIYNAAEPDAFALPKTAATGEVKIMQPSLEKALRECTDPDVYFPVKMVIRLDAYRKINSYMSIFNIDDPFIFEGRNFAQNHEYFENNEAIKVYMEEYSKWFNDVYMDKSFAAADKDPLEVFSEYFRQNHTSGEYEEYLKAIEKLDAFNRAYSAFIENTVDERMGCGMEFGLGPTKALKEIAGVEYMLRFQRQDAYWLDTFENIYFPDTLNVLMNKEQIESLIFNGCEDYSMFLYWADIEAYDLK
ncbi:MAG: hypothetical protein J6U10_03020 [Lachnospiraceae bacterium]|nr:hypothetical protein [Lachnospiraceae bacterium]